MAVAAILALVTGFLLAHFVGERLARNLRVAPGHIREVMPTLPVAPILRGRAAQRWNHAIRRVEARLLKKFRDGARGVEATALAGELAEDSALVAAALERMREEIPCRLRITASGKLLHDFHAHDIQALRRKRRRSWPFRALVFVLASLANVGAIWPVLLILMLAVGTLKVVMATATSAEGASAGWTGIFIIAAVAAAAFALGVITDVLLTPLINSLRLARPMQEERLPQRLPQHQPSTVHDDTGLWVWFGSSHGHRRRRSSRSSGSGGSGGGSSDDLGQAIVIIILIAIIVICTIALFVWFRGLWRAITQRDDELDRIAPGFWVRTCEPLDKFERFLPTNDLVGRMARALHRTHAHRRPVDADMGARILALARRNDGQTSTLEIALNEGLDLHEAAEVGSRLCGIVGGDIGVSDAGDLVFRYPNTATRQVSAELDDDLWAEYLDFEGKTIRRRAFQEPDSVPVNLVGLTKGHLEAGARLAGGSIFMALSAIFLVAPDFQIAGDLMPGIGPFGESLFMWCTVAFAIGATCLVAAARYSAAATALHGVRRDARRAAFYEIRRAIEHGEQYAHLSRYPEILGRRFQAAWDKVDEAVLEKEVEHVLIDLDLSPDLDERGRWRIDVTPLRRRLESARRPMVEDVLRDPLASFEATEDEVVFETEIVHDRITVLA